MGVGRVFGGARELRGLFWADPVEGGVAPDVERTVSDGGGADDGVMEVEAGDDIALWGGGIDGLDETFFVDEVEEISCGDGGCAVGAGGSELPRFLAIDGFGSLEDAGVIQGVDAVLKDDGAHGGALHLIILPSGFGFSG